MNVAKSHSHLNGEEWLKVHQPEDYDELLEVIADIDAEKCRTKRSREKRMKGKLLYSPTDLNSEFAVRLNRLGWESHRYNYYVAHSHEQAEVMAEQREYLEQRGYDTIYSYNQTDHVKDEIAVEVQFGKYAFVAYDLFVKHLVFYTGRAISVGIEVLPTKSMQREMSSGIGYYEGELHNLLRHGRNNPAVPLVILGIEPEGMGDS